MKKTAIIVAGGTGQRMGTTLPKQFLAIEGKSILLHTIGQFATAFADINFIIVLPADYIQDGKALISSSGLGQSFQFVDGGDTRFQSVKNGLAQADPASIVFVHDAVRCLLTPALIQRCYQQAVEKGSAIPAVSSTDTIRILEGNQHHVVDRANVMMIQTPQTFNAALLKKAFEQAYQPSFTDEANVLEASGKEVYLIEGEYENIKITRPLDLAIAEYILAKRASKE
ncbi:MAG: 2-C-methyl-D-erythritol 4-phosphate cytidylyltransferase [Chitinophagia bacterium]|nr:2-C-methyl-D-erythritol 4-phosphate cytidylyltransferase [Chitinophagia bacterium]